MEVLSNPYVICGLLGVIAGLFAYAAWVPKNNEKFDVAAGVVNRLGSDLYSALPAGSVKKRSRPRMASLVQRSGNPWNLTVDEFAFMRWVCGFIGAIAGVAAWALLDIFDIHIPWWALIVGCTVFGFFIPQLKYKDQAKERDLAFKRQLPEALDLVIISLAGGVTFVQALRESLPNMSDGVLKEEFAALVRNVDAGRSLDESLQHFANRAPNESIKTFVTAVRQANELNVPLADVLTARSEASRQDFFALIQTRTAILPTKMMVALVPTLIPALLILVLAPSLSSLVNSMG